MSAPGTIGLVRSPFGWRLWNREDDEGKPADATYSLVPPGYRILAPGQLDRDTLEAAAKYHEEKAREIAADMANDDGHFGAAHAIHVFSAAALRAMQEKADG